MPDVVRIRQSAPVSTGSTIVFLYPAGRSANDYRQDGGAVLYARALQNAYRQNVDFTLAYGELQVTVTWLNSITIPFDSTQVYPDNYAGPWAVGIELPLNIDAALVLPPARGNDIYTLN